MPTYTILGLQVWIPDLTDLYNFVVKPLSDFVDGVIRTLTSTIWGWLQWLPSAVYNALAPTVNAIWNFLLGVAAQIYNLLKPLVDQVWSWILQAVSQIQGFFQYWYGQLWSVLQPILSSIWSGLQNVGSLVLQAIAPSLNALMAVLQGDIKPLQALILSTARTLLDFWLKAWPEFGLALSGLSVTLDALWAQAQGQPVEFEKILAAKLNEVLNPLAKIPEDFMKALNDYIVKPAMAALQNIAATLDPYFRQLGSLVLDTVHSIAAGTPEMAVERATATAATLGGLVTAVNIAAQALELLHPIKHMGIVATVTSILDVMGIRPFATGMFAAIVAGAIYKPVYQGLAIRYRPEIPPTTMADTMLFQRQILEGEWRRIYGLHGWPEKYITAWYGSMWTEPSDRMIVGMVEGGEVDLDWLLNKLQRRGYKPEDAAVIMRYGTRKALADEIAAGISEINSDLLEGQEDLLGAQQRLQDLGVRGKELELRLKNMAKRIERKDVRDKIEILTTQAKAEEITIEAYRNGLIALNLRMPRINALVEKEEARRKPKVEIPTERKRDLAASTYQRLFVEDVIKTEAILRRYLTELTPPYKPDRIELLILDAKLRKAKVSEVAA
jgi:hypothetical protein